MKRHKEIGGVRSGMGVSPMRAMHGRDAYAILLAATLAITTAIMVTGCSVGPNYHEPKMQMSGQFRTPPTTQIAPGKPTDVMWWRTFGDPMLDALVVDAWQGGLDVKAAAARVRQARALRPAAAAGFWPTANATGRYQRSRTGSNSATITGTG